MFDPSVIFQRTHAGRDEIQNKSHGLTQSERLVLIMIDGAAPFAKVRSQLSALTDDRFNRAVTKLLSKELVLEVFMPLEGHPPEILDQALIDRFLHQDPLDPVTIMLVDLDEQFDELHNSASASDSPQPPSSDVELNAPVKQEPASVSEVAAMPEPALNEDHKQQADALGEEVRARQLERVPRIEVVKSSNPQPAPFVERRMSERRQAAPLASSGFLRLHWGYWLIGLGTAFIAGYVVSRLLS